MWTRFRTAVSVNASWLKTAVAVGVVALLIAVPPLLMGTSVYPVAVVRGNSMYPVLMNGDLVIFRRVDASDIPNGTIIVFVQGDAPVDFLNYLVRPVVIHEVIDRVVNEYGKIYYKTKGTNNLYPDSGLVPAQNVLGVPAVVLPRVGFVITFLTSPEGMVAMIGILVMYYIEASEKIRRREKFNRAQFVAPFLRLRLDDKISSEEFVRVCYISEHCDDLSKAGVGNALSDWLSSNLHRKWEHRIAREGDDDIVEFYGKGIVPLKMSVGEIRKALKEGAARGIPTSVESLSETAGRETL